MGQTSASDQSYFEVLTEEDDIHGRWTVKTLTGGLEKEYPDLSDVELAYRAAGEDQSISYSNNLRTTVCTVAFINRPLGMAKCKKSCTKMGASQFRWFHEGCCECIGEYCFNYGLGEPKCEIRD